MLINDPIGDLLTRIRNGQKALKSFVNIPLSKEKEALVKVLVHDGYVSSYTIEESKNSICKDIRVVLKYVNGVGAINTIKRVSKPGRRVYCAVKDLKPVYNGLGINILSTSKGIVSDVVAREISAGGEVLCSVF